MAEPFNWTCPHCSRATTIVGSNFSSKSVEIWLEAAHGYTLVNIFAVLCPNKDCNELTLSIGAFAAKDVSTSSYSSLARQVPIGRGSVRFLPKSAARNLPEYVPAPIREDYEEASLIVNDSPKAAATLARRAIQGIIRDFWKDKVKAGRLIDEIASIKDVCDPATWSAIDAVRSVGNIGAHMEKDINVVVDVDPDEATLLISLIETLVDDWYVARAVRAARMDALVKLAEAKDPKKIQPKS